MMGENCVISSTYLCVQCPYDRNNKVMHYVQTLPVFSETSKFCSILLLLLVYFSRKK